jgi:hypothetical protein
MTTTADVMAATGASFRQLDHWIHRGWLNPVGGPLGAGSGHAREWPALEYRVAVVMARLVRAGMGPEKSAAIARVAAEQAHKAAGPVNVQIAHGITLEVMPV